MNSSSFTPQQIGGLTEVANVGIGNATANLSQLLKRRCLIEIPKIGPLDEDVRRLLDSPDSYMAHLQIKIAEQSPASIFIVMDKSDSHNIMAAVPKDGIKLESGIMTAQSILRQVGEIMAESFFQGLSELLMHQGRYSLPAITVHTAPDPMGLILQSLKKQAEGRLAIHSAFYDREKTFRGKFVYLIGEDFLMIVFKWLNLMIKKGEKE